MTRKKVGLGLVVALVVGGIAAGYGRHDHSQGPSDAANAPAGRADAGSHAGLDLAPGVADSTTVAYDVELAVMSRLSLPGSAAPLAGDVTLKGLLDVTTEDDGALRVSFRAGHSNVGAATILGHSLAGPLESGVARFRLGPDGSPEALSFTRHASPLFEHVVSLLVRETFPPRFGAAGRDEATPLGRARATYAFEPRGVRRERAYLPAVAAAGTLTGDARLVAQFDDFGVVDVDVAEAISSTDLRSFSGTLRARRTRLPGVGVTVADVETPAPPSLRAAPAPSHGAPSGSLTAAAIVGRIGATRAGAPAGGDAGAEHARFLWDARALLSADPDAVRAVEATARTADEAGRGLALDLLAQSGSPAGQAAFMRLTTERVRAGDDRAAAELQRLVLVEGATNETLIAASAFLDAGDPVVRRAALYAIGGALHGAVASETRDQLVGSFEEALAGADDADAVHLVAALGNAGAPSSRTLLEQTLSSGAGELAEGAARALRHYDDSAALLIRHLSGGLAIADAALESLDAISRRDVTVVPLVAAALLDAGLPSALVGEAFGFLKRHAFGEYGQVVVAAIAALAELPGVAATTRGQMRDFVMLAGGGV